MRRSPFAVLLVVVVLALTAACSDDGGDDRGPDDPGITTPSTAPSSFTEPGSPSSAPPVSTTVVDRCADPPGPISGSSLTIPADAEAECDEGAGWRFFFWIGGSGDPIYRVQRLQGDAWSDVQYDVACELTGDSLRQLGVPLQLALAWGDQYSGQC
jgi:hypothetical protein